MIFIILSDDLIILLEGMLCCIVDPYVRNDFP